MKKIIYLIRHSSPFIEIENYDDYRNIKWSEYNKNMILSCDGEKKASELCNIDELKNIKDVYSSNSFRALSTAKYIAENNSVKIKLDDRINEREFGVEYLNELPEKFNKISFDDKDFKIQTGESLNEMDDRLNSFINEFLQSKIEKCVLVMHGIMLLSFLQNNCDFLYDGEIITITYKEKKIVEDKPKSPGVYKIVYENNKIIDIDVVN